MGLGNIYFNYINRSYFKDIPIGLLLINWFFQRILRINSSAPFSVHFTSRISNYSYMKIPKSSWPSFAISGGCYIAANKERRLILGEDFVFAPNVVINTSNHDLLDRNKYVGEEIVIKNNVWIAANVVVLAGCELGNNLTVAAGAVVNNSFGDNLVVGGVPAKILKRI